MSKNSSPRVLCTSIKNRVPSRLDRFTAYYNCMSKNVTKLISPRVLCTSITNRVPRLFDCFKAYYNCMRKISPNSYLREFCAQVSQIVFLADLTVLQLIRTVWAKISQNSYLLGFCAQVSKIVFLADLTVLRLITTVWAKVSQNSYLRKFCAQVSQIVFLAEFTVLRLITNVCTKMSQKLISPLVLCTSRINRVLNWFDRFTAYKKIMSKNITKLISP